MRRLLPTFAAALLLFAASADAERPLFSAKEISTPLDYLRSEECKEELDFDRIKAARTALRSFVREKGGAALLAEAVQKLEGGSPEDRLRASLILQQFETLPESVLDRLAASKRLDLRTWALFSRPGKIPELELRTDRRFVRAAKPGDDAPFIAVARDFRRRIAIPEAELKGMKEEFVEGYRREFLPRLPEFWKSIPATARTHVDFDGDGIDEIVSLAEFPDGWAGAGRRVFSILKKAGEKGAWSIAWLWVLHQQDRYVKFTCDDYDGDGRPELVLTSTLLMGWTWEQMWIFDDGALGKPIELGGRRAYAVRDPLTRRAIFVDQSTFNPTGGGKAMYLVTTIGSEFQVVALRPDAPPRTATVHTGKSAW